MTRASLLAFLITLLVTLVCLRSCAVLAEQNNGFDLSKTAIPAEQILPGGPDRDGIPSIDKPRFVSVTQSHWLADSDQVLSLNLNGVVRAYPILIMNWHEIVNDNFAGDAVVISYCPLCGTGMAFSSQVAGHELEFGVSGLLYNSDVLLYDRQTESLWSQIMAKAVSGPQQGQALEMLPLQQMTWAEWKAIYPEGEVLSKRTGFFRDYSRSPYGDYEQSRHLYFPVSFLSHRFHPKERVLGVEVNGKFKAYPFAELAKHQGNIVEDRFNGEELVIRFNAKARTGRIEFKQSQQIKPSVNAFWFAWFGFYPETSVYTAP